MSGYHSWRRRPISKRTQHDALLQQRIQDAYDDAEPSRSPGDTFADYMLIPRLVMNWLFPVIAVLAVYLFMRGHDMPGGGFVAALVLADR